MISLRSVSRKVSTDWRGPLLIGNPGLDGRVDKPLDFYEYARKIGAAGADVLLTSPSRGAWQASRHRFGRIVVQSGAAGGGIVLGGTSQADSFVVYLRDPDCHAALRLNGASRQRGSTGTCKPRGALSTGKRGSPMSSIRSRLDLFSNRASLSQEASETDGVCPTP